MEFYVSAPYPQFSACSAQGHSHSVITETAFRFREDKSLWFFCCWEAMRQFAIDRGANPDKIPTHQPYGVYENTWSQR